MRRFRTVAVAATAAGMMAVPGTALAETGGGHPVTPVAEGLDGPRQVSDYGEQLIVAEYDTGEISAVDQRTGEVTTLLTVIGGPQGVDARDGRLYVAMGDLTPPPDAPPEEQPPPGSVGSVLLVADEDSEVLQSVDLLAYELEANPDGQSQYLEDGVTLVEVLSNPYAVLAQDDRVLVADAGANAVLSVDHDGEVSTFFVPPVVTEVPECATAENNPGTVGCDSVPTGIAEGPDGLIYVSTLGGDVPGAARVYVLDEDGNEVRRIEGLTGATGVAVDDCAVYVSHVLEGAPAEEGPPPADFDPAAVGEVVRIDADGTRTTAQVTMPTGLLVEKGELYASAWGVASFLGLQGAGQIVRVAPEAFSSAG